MRIHAPSILYLTYCWSWVVPGLHVTDSDWVPTRLSCMMGRQDTVESSQQQHQGIVVHTQFFYRSSRCNSVPTLIWGRPPPSPSYHHSLPHHYHQRGECCTLVCTPPLTVCYGAGVCGLLQSLPDLPSCFHNIMLYLRLFLHLCVGCLSVMHCSPSEAWHTLLTFVIVIPGWSLSSGLGFLILLLHVTLSKALFDWASRYSNTIFIRQCAVIYVCVYACADSLAFSEPWCTLVIL